MKKRFLLKSLMTFFVLSLIFSGCRHDSDKDGNGKVNPPAKIEAGSLIKLIEIGSANGQTNVIFNGQEINVKDFARIGVVLLEGLEGDNARIEATFGNDKVKFSDFSENNGHFVALCNDVKGIAAEAKEMKIKVTLGNKFEEKNFNLRALDESTLQTLDFTEFKIGSSDVKDQIKKGPSWRVYDKNSKTLKFTIKTNQDLDGVTIVVDGTESELTPKADNKKIVEHEIEFEKNTTKVISFLFKASNCKDLVVPPFRLIYTNAINAVVSVNSTGRAVPVSEPQVLSGKLAFEKCTQTEPEIEIKVMKMIANNDNGKLTKVTVDGKDVEINTENAGQSSEATIAKYKLNPPLEKAGENKTVKVHVEGTSSDGSVTYDPLDFEVTFTLASFIKTKTEIAADGKGFVQLNANHRVYSGTVDIKITAAEDNLRDAFILDYKDATGNTPDFEITGREATAKIKLVDTGLEATSFKVMLKAEGKTDTVVPISVRYSTQKDQLGIGGKSFGQRDLEQMKDAKGNTINKMDADNALRMAKEKVTLYILVSREAKEITSIKVNGAEVKDKNYADPDHIIASATTKTQQGQGGTSLNAVIVIGSDSMVLDKVYELDISLTGKTEDGHELSEVHLLYNKLGPDKLKIKLPNYGENNTQWRSPNGDWETAMDHTASNVVYYEKDKGKHFNNYYGVKSLTLSFNPKNPRAKVKGFWYKRDSANTEKNAILADPTNSKYAGNWITFKEGITLDGNSKWCFDLNLDDADKKHQSIGVFCYVVAADGSTTNKDQECDYTVNTPYENTFHQLNMRAWYYDEKDDANKAMHFTDKLEIDTTKANNAGKKLYFKAVSSAWQSPKIEYHLFSIGQKTLPEGISEFKMESYGTEYINCFHYFTLDVTKLLDGTKDEIEVSIPVWLKGTYTENNETKNYEADVFTRKFKVVKKS